jgi:hypothetical protein
MYFRDAMDGLWMLYFRGVTLLGVGAISSFVFLIFHSFCKREDSFYILFVYVLQAGINQEMKMIYHHPRPFMSSD